jgi:hypothetical protein
MSWYDNMQSRLLAQGGNIADSQKIATKQVIINSFKDSPSYKSVLINGIPTDVRLSAGKETNFKVMSLSNFKSMYLLPDTTVNIGAVVTIDSEYWIVTDFQLSDIYPSAQLQKSNQLLKWQNSNYQIKTVHSIITNKFDYIDDDKFMITSSAIFTITIPSNTDTVLIKRNDRFLFNNSAYTITHIDSTTVPGLLKLSATESVLGENDINGVADYEAGNYSIVVKNGSTLILGIDQQLQLDIDVFYGEHILNTAISYSSSNSNVVSITSSGLIISLTSGTSTITIRSLGVTTTVSVVVNDDIIVDLYSIQIDGSSEILKNVNNTYLCKMFNNGILIEPLPCTWSLNNSKANIISQTNDNCIIKGVIEGSAILTCTLDSDITINTSKDIQIKGLW